MQDPTKYNKKYFMACATYWCITATFTDERYYISDIYSVMEDIGVPDKYQKKVAKLVEEMDDEYDC